MQIKMQIDFLINRIDVLKTLLLYYIPYVPRGKNFPYSNTIIK